MNNTTTFYSLYKMFILNITMEATTSEWTEADSSDTKLKLVRSIANFIGIKLTGIIIIVGIIANFISFVTIVKSDLKSQYNEYSNKGGITGYLLSFICD